MVLANEWPHCNKTAQAKASSDEANKQQGQEDAALAQVLANKANKRQQQEEAACAHTLTNKAKEWHQLEDTHTHPSSG